MEKIRNNKANKSKEPEKRNVEHTFRTKRNEDMSFQAVQNYASLLLRNDDSFLAKRRKAYEKF